MFLVFAALGLPHLAQADLSPTTIQSPNGRNAIRLHAAREGSDRVLFSVRRDGLAMFGPSSLGPVLEVGGSLGEGSRVVEVKRGEVDERFSIPWGKTSTVVNRCSFALLTLTTDSNIRWQIELRAYNDGVAFRYRLLRRDNQKSFRLLDEVTRFDVVGEPSALFNKLSSFHTAHESLYEHKPFAAIPAKALLDCPLLLTWPDGRAAAITEARVLRFAGAYLERTALDESAVRIRLSPLPSQDGACVTGELPHVSPWRVVMLADEAGDLLESNLLLCLNDPPRGDFRWAEPGKTTFHWWYGEFEDDYKLPGPPGAYAQKHKAYIDFCAENGFAYHTISGDGFAWYTQSRTDYGTPAPDANLLVPRPEFELPKILAYAKKRGVGIRLWVHWKPLSEQLEEAFTRYESWGVKGLMVDFLDRDDQEMIEFTERMLESAARHKLHIQIHGCSKYSGEQRTYPHLFNREGVLNLEHVKWSSQCTPAHSVNVAYTRALTGPVDFHSGGFRSVSRADFQPRDRAPVVMGTRCHNMALFVVFENPMPMMADAPHAYNGQPGFEFLKQVPTTWDETRFLAGKPGEYVILARRKSDAWYLGGITNWTPREVDLSLEFLARGELKATLFVDGSMEESHPNELRKLSKKVDATSTVHISMAPGGGFTAILRPEEAGEEEAGD